MINILAFSGSTRSGSYNKKILEYAVKGARDAGANVTVIDLRDFTLPLYDGDLENNDGLPINCIKLQNLFLKHQGLLLALPEYNSSVSGVFKNTIDWVSRPIQEKKETLSCFNNKTVALMSASTGKLGGIRVLAHARSILENINAMVIPKQICVESADKVFDYRGVLQEKESLTSLQKLGSELAHLIEKIIPPSVMTYHKNTKELSSIKGPSKLDKKLINAFENEGGLISPPSRASSKSKDLNTSIS